MEKKENYMLTIVVALVIGVVLGSAIIVSAINGSKDEKKSITVPVTPQQSFEQSGISQERAEAIASKVVTGIVEGSDQVVKSGRELYVVEISKDGVEYEVEVDAHSGEVLRAIQETEVGAKELALVDAAITQEEAKALALATIDGTFKEIEAEKENGRYVYDVEIERNGEEISVNIDIETGEVLGIEREVQPETPKNAKVTEEEAKAIAVKAVGGVVTDFEVDREFGKTVFEVELNSGGYEVDVLIDPDTGKVIATEWDD